LSSRTQSFKFVAIEELLFIFADKIKGKITCGLPSLKMLENYFLFSLKIKQDLAGRSMPNELLILVRDAHPSRNPKAAKKY